MGFFSGFGNVAGNVNRGINQLSNSARGIGRGISTGFGLIGGGGGENPPEQKEDPRITSLRSEQQKRVQELKDEAPKYIESQENQLENEAKRAQYEGEKKVRENYNRRGLLYSGNRVGDEASLRSQIGSQLYSGSKALREETEQAVKGQENALAAIGLDSYREEVQRAQDLYNLRMENSVKRRQALQQLGSAIGYGVGSYASKGAAQAPTRDLYSNDWVGQDSYFNDNLMDPYDYNQGLLGADLGEL